MGCASYHPFPLTQLIRAQAGAPAGALTFEEAANVTLLLKVRGFPALLSEEHAGRGVTVEEEAVKDEQENLVAGRYSKHFFIS